MPKRKGRPVDTSPPRHIAVVPDDEDGSGHTPKPLAADRPLYERQPDESEPAWEAFVRYRTMPALERTYARVASELGKSTTLIDRWGKVWSWQARIAEWEREQDRVRRQAHLDEIEAMSKRHAQLAQANLSAVMQPVTAFLREIQSNPRFMAALTEVPEDATLKQRIEAIERTFSLIARAAALIPSLVNVERLARGEPTQIDEVRNTEALDPRQIIADPETADLASELYARIGNRVG